jgi:hypothetical protein
MRVFAGFAADSPVTRTEASSTLLSLIGIRSHFEGAWSNVWNGHDSGSALGLAPICPLLCHIGLLTARARRVAKSEFIDLNNQGANSRRVA